MPKNVLLISCSLRQSSNSDALAHAFAKGAGEAGHRTGIVSLAGKSIAFCRGCLSCQKTARCVMHDDVDAIAEKMRAADVVVWATPVYYYEMCGQMKTLIDRLNPLYHSDYRFRDVYLLSAAAEDGDGVDEGTLHGLSGWLACYEKAHLAGKVFAGGVEATGDIEGHPALREAYEMGRAIG